MQEHQRVVGQLFGRRTETVAIRQRRTPRQCEGDPRPEGRRDARCHFSLQIISTPGCGWAELTCAGSLFRDAAPPCGRPSSPPHTTPYEPTRWTTSKNTREP